MTQEEKINRTKEKVVKSIKESTDRYLEADNRANWERLFDSENRQGTYMVRTWPDYAAIDVTYVCDSLRWADTGDMIATFSTEYFSVDDIVKLIVMTIDMYES